MFASDFNPFLFSEVLIFHSNNLNKDNNTNKIIILFKAKESKEWNSVDISSSKFYRDRAAKVIN
jgi:hypothetical protein